MLSDKEKSSDALFFLKQKFHTLRRNFGGDDDDDAAVAIACRALSLSLLRFLQAASNPRLGLWFLGGGGCVQVDELLLLVRQLRVTSVVMDAHALAVRRRGLANRTCEFRMSAFVNPLTIR